MKALGFNIGYSNRTLSVSRPGAPPQNSSERRPRGGAGAMRLYDGAKTDRLATGWTTRPLTIDEVVRMSLRTLRARSRDAGDKNDYQKKFKSLARSNIIGPQGIGLQARAKWNNKTPDIDANDAIEDGFRKWGEPGYCDVTGTLSWKVQQNLVINTVVEDGEALMIEHRGANAGPYGYALQHLDPELLDVNYDREDLPNGNYIRMGIEFTQLGRPVAYHLIDAKSSDYSYSYSSRKYRPISAEKIIHLFIVERVGQKRGLPWNATSIFHMKMLDGYDDAALVNARFGASQMGFITSEHGQHKGDGEDGLGNTVIEVEPGVFRHLNPGEKVEKWDPEYPNGEYDGFEAAQLRRIAAGLGVSYTSLSGNLKDVNFSSIRAGLLEERSVWQALQQWMIEYFHQRVYRNWLQMALLNRKLWAAGAPLSPEREMKYREVVWMPRGWKWVDPKKEMEANEKAINENVKTASAVIREEGNDPDEVFRERAWELNRMKELGITPAKKPKASGNQKEDKDDDDETDDKDDE
ncbi:MAG: phage portal protein [Candidatus Eisenbacteria bacterium]|uniref:Phage portal protein n=1 Tax=Eiseniibacteriota bacterium TaxID=2212470 RepID=A0A948RXP4_UNCEI|nr:phage portal protein [Candidatus Eisenbacteria bacterium]MBU1948150.1 phage portal protein [Candidatus Eisenbacteria bacterium]MBU2691876.1 phage portal protein [Candidatus Eisenbacteria bacterium]